MWTFSGRVVGVGTAGAVQRGCYLDDIYWIPVLTDMMQDLHLLRILMEDAPVLLPIICRSRWDVSGQGLGLDHGDH